MTHADTNIYQPKSVITLLVLITVSIYIHFKNLFKCVLWWRQLPIPWRHRILMLRSPVTSDTIQSCRSATS